MISRKYTGALAFAAIVALFSTPRAAFAWGDQAHAAIDRAAILDLPEDGPVFLRDYIDYIGESATLPDTWRSASEPFAKIEEDPNHHWYLEQFQFMREVPRSRYGFVIAIYDEYRRISAKNKKDAERMNVHWTGTLPYAAMEEYGHLVADMRLLRKARELEYKEKAHYLEQSCAFFIIRLGHYIGDGSQPLHLSIHANGWRGENPKGYTVSPKIHGLFEADFVRRIGLTTEDVRRGMAPVARQDGDMFDAVVAYLRRSGTFVEDVYKYEKSGALEDGENREAKALVLERTSSGAAMLRDMIYRAWKESSLPPAKMPNPIDPDHPRYDPTTGSAPAPSGKQ